MLRTFSQEWSNVKLILVFLSISFVACTSNKTLIPTEENIPVDLRLRADIMEVDEFGHIYIVNDQNTLVKYNQKGEKLYDYSPIQWGDMESIDVRDPFKIVVFFPDFQKVKIIDNTLSEISEFDLQNFSYAISAVAMSNDNDLWIYNQADNKIIKTSNSGAIILSSQPLSDIVGASFKPQFFKEVQNQIYCYDPNYGLLVFDYSAHFIKRYLFLDKNLNNVETAMITCITNNQIEVYNDFENDLLLTNATVMKLDFKPKVIRRFDNQWIVLTRDGVLFDAKFSAVE